MAGQRQAWLTWGHKSTSHTGRYGYIHYPGLISHIAINISTRFSGIAMHCYLHDTPENIIYICTAKSGTGNISCDVEIIGHMLRISLLGATSQ